MLSQQEIKRYNRHIILPEIGLEGQHKLKQAKVLVIGAGGLGCPVLMYLAAVGVGTIGIVDFDKIDASNLQRQILYSIDDIGKYKAEVAKQKLSSQNPYVHLIAHISHLTSQNALELIAQYDIVVDGSDNFATRYLLNDACVMLNKPLVAASVFKFEGQLSVYNYKNGPTYRCLFPEPPTESPSCSEIGVIGVLPGILGTLQANEVIKIITKTGQILSGKLLFIDALSLQFRELQFEKNLDIKIEKLGEYELLNCEVSEDTSHIKEISVVDLKAEMNASEPFVIIDVREAFEYDICNLKGVLIPLNELPQHIHKIPKDKKVVVICHHGMRSAMAINYLQENYKYKNLYNLSGGIAAWANQVDAAMQQY
jgi:molybdopterin/thiamine biosynthesis adenylyltransferase/rhodanese-related sulfurtransferase